MYYKLKLNIARSEEEAKEQSKSGKAIITTEITGGDIRSERAQKDAKRFEKKKNDKNIEIVAEEETKKNDDNTPLSILNVETKEKKLQKENEQEK